MKMTLIFLSVFLVFCVCGCSSNPERVELTEETFFSTRFNASEVIEVNLVATKHTANWVGVYKNVFPISDANRIKTIINCIGKGGSFSVYADKRVLLIEANLISKDPANREKTYTKLVSVKDPTQINTIIDCIRRDREIVRFGETDEVKLQYNMILFKTPRTVYYTGIRWDNEMVYGDWWESPELLSIFRGWGLFEDLAKADPNWPPIKRIGTPSGERVPFTREPNSSRFQKWSHSRGRDINDK